MMPYGIARQVWFGVLVLGATSGGGPAEGGAVLLGTKTASSRAVSGSLSGGRVPAATTARRAPARLTTGPDMTVANCAVRCLGPKPSLAEVPCPLGFDPAIHQAKVTYDVQNIGNVGVMLGGPSGHQEGRTELRMWVTYLDGSQEGLAKVAPATGLYLAARTSYSDQTFELDSRTSRLRPGVHKFTVSVDPDRRIAELNEENNSVECYFQVVGRQSPPTQPP